MRELWSVEECKLYTYIKKPKTQSKGHNSETESNRNIVPDTSSWPDIHSYKVSWRYPKWLRSYGAYNNFLGQNGKNESKGHNLERNSFSCIWQTRQSHGCPFAEKLKKKPPQKTSLFSPYFNRSETWNVFEEHIINLSIFVWNPFVNDIVSVVHNNHH